MLPLEVSRTTLHVTQRRTLNTRVAHETLGFDTVGFRTGKLPPPAGGGFHRGNLPVM